MSGNVLSDDFGVGLDIPVDQARDAAARYDPKVTYTHDAGHAEGIKGSFAITYLKNSPNFNSDGGAELYHQTFDERAGFRQTLDNKLATGEGDNGLITQGDIASMGQFTMSVVVDDNIIKGYATKHDGTPMGWNEFRFTRGNHVSNPSVTRLDNVDYLVSFTVKTDANATSSMGHVLHCFTTYCNGFSMEYGTAGYDPMVSNSHLVNSTEGIIDHVRTAKLINNQFISVFRSNNPTLPRGENENAVAIYGIKWDYSSSTGGDVSGSDSYLNEYSNSRGTPFEISDFSGLDMLTPEVAGFSDGGYVVVWVSPAGDGSNDAVLMKVFN